MEDDDLAYGGVEDGRFVISIRSEKLTPGLTEFRCRYSNSGSILGLGSLYFRKQVNPRARNVYFYLKQVCSKVRLRVKSFVNRYSGYSRPFVLSVYDASEKMEATVPKMTWGESVRESRILKEGQSLTNIANCWQSISGEPDMLQFGFRYSARSK